MTDNVKIKNKHAVRSFFTPRRILCLTFFIFTLVTAACRSFFGLYPFGFAAASAASGLFAAAASTAGAAAGSLLSSSPYGGYLALLSVLLFAARLLVSWWLTTDERENRDRRRQKIGRKSFLREKSGPTYIKRENRTKSASNRGKSGGIAERNEKIVSPRA